MPNDLAIVMTLCQRPHYTKRVLDALERCDGIKGVPVFLLCEPVCDAVFDLAKKFRGPCEVIKYASRVGCNINTNYALCKGFENADRVIAMEDDTVPAKDFLTFTKWALDEYEDDKAVFSVSGYQKTRQEELHRTTEVVRENWFTPWGWATWRDRWETVNIGWPADDNQISWDTVLHRGKLGSRCEIRPVVARIQNIGADGGLHVPSREWHVEHHLNPYWSEVSEPVAEGTAFTEVKPTKGQLRATYPC